MAARAVITGGDGYLGRRLVRLLSEAGTSVLVVDDGRLGREPAPQPGDVRRVPHDFADPKALAEVRDFEPDTVFHLAAMHFVPDCDRDPAACYAINVLGTERLLATLRDTRVRAVVFCSSAVVYGFADTPRRESDPLAPQHVYAYSKWLGEGLLRGLHEDRPDVRTVAARMFNLVGPGDTARHVIPEIVEAVAAGRTLRLGNTWPRRDYIHVEDVASALAALAPGEPVATAVNVGTGEGRSVADAIETLGQILGTPATVVADPDRMRAVDGHLVADVTLLRERTGWRPAWTFETTLRQLLGDLPARLSQ